ncbi:MAG: hypothetical protein HN377_09680 [Alphaproteobacteria bacterium]|nr:hypothetical protein [Alphaproteobacteria bacterium]
MGEVKISKDEESKNWTNIAVSVSFGAVGAFGAMVFAIFVASRFFDFSFLQEASCREGDNYIYCFFDKKWDSGTYLSIITSFYSTVIAVLIGLLGAVVAFAYITIKGTSHQWVEDVAEKAIGRYFEKNEFHEQVFEIVKARSRDVIKGLDSFQDDLSERLEELTLRFALWFFGLPFGRLFNFSY